MALYDELVSLRKSGKSSDFLTQFSKQLDISNSKWEKEDEERRKRQQKDQLKQQAIADEEAIKRDTSPSLFQQLKRFGAAGALDTAKETGEAVIQGPQRVARGVARVLPGGTADLEASEQAVQQQSNDILQITKKLNDPKLPEDQKSYLRELANNLGQNQEPAEALVKVTSQIRDDTDKRKFLAAVAETGLFAFGGATAGIARKLGTVGKAALFGAEGAAGGAAVALQADEPTVGSVATSTAIGAGASIGLGALISKVSSIRKLRKAEDLLPSKVGEGADIITDRSRLLTEKAGPSGGRSKGFIQRIEQDPRAAVIVRGADIKDVNRLNAIDEEIMVAQRTGNLSPDEARALLRERQEVIERIRNPQTEIAKEITAADERIANARTKTQRIRAEQDKEFLQQQALVDARNANIADDLGVGTGAQRTSTLALKTEAKAVGEDLTKGFDNLPTYSALDLDEQANRVVNIMDADYEAAKRIALGKQIAPEGVNPEAVYIGVRNRAVRDGDSELLRQLAEESTIPGQASIKGQQIASLKDVDPESPIKAMREILEARKITSKTIGLDVPQTISKLEAETITKLAKEAADAKVAVLSGGDRLAYGRARVAFDNYTGELLIEASRPGLKESMKKLSFYGKAVKGTFGLAKSLVATLDNSVIGRQGWKTLMTNPKVWAKNSLKSFKDMADVYSGKEVLDHVHADMVSRPNALNGLYKKAGLDVYGAKKSFLEEAFPVSFKKVTGSKVGRFVLRPLKASEVAFTAWQQRTRADLFDQYIELARRSGVDIASKKEVASIGKLTNSLTSRGHLGRTGERFAEGFNIAFFAPKLVKSHIDVLGGHIVTGAGGSKFVRKQAAKNLLKIAIGSASALKLAEVTTGGKVEWDPRSSNFGKIRIGDTRFDLTGGMAGLVTLGARFITDSTKSSVTGEVKKLNTGEFGSQTTWDTLISFAENKLSPGARVIMDWKKGEDFDGKKPTIQSTVKNLTMPLIIQQYSELKNNPRSANILVGMIAEGLGISANTYGLDKDWNVDNNKQIDAFKAKVDKKTFEEANKDFNDQFTDWYTKVSNDDRFWKLPIEQRESLVTSKKKALTDEVMESRGYTYKQPKPKKDRSTESIIDELKKYK